MSPEEILGQLILGMENWRVIVPNSKTLPVVQEGFLLKVFEIPV